jgi:hypothetical protein
MQLGRRGRLPPATAGLLVSCVQHRSPGFRRRSVPAGSGPGSISPCIAAPHGAGYALPTLASYQGVRPGLPGHRLASVRMAGAHVLINRHPPAIAPGRSAVEATPAMATQPMAVRVRYCSRTARGAQRSPKAPGDDRSTSPVVRQEIPATLLDSATSGPRGSDAVLPYHGLHAATGRNPQQRFSPI